MSIGTLKADEVITVHLSGSPTPAKIAVSDVSKILFEKTKLNIIANNADNFFNYSDVKTITFDKGEVGLNPIFVTGASAVVAPNPTKENLTICGADNMHGSDIFIYSITGTLVSEHRNWNGEVINISHLGSGVYFININSTTLKFVKQ